MADQPISNQQHSTLSPRQAEFIDSFLESTSTPRRRKHWLPSHIQQTVTTPIAVQASQIPDHAADADAANHRILHQDQLDIQAARTILDREISCNAINVKHYRWILQSLLHHMLSNPGKSSTDIPHQAEYARILQRLSTTLTTIELQQPHDSKPSFPRHRRLSHVEYLHKLVQDMEKGFVVMQQRGSEDEVYLVHTDMTPSELVLVGHSEHLKSLASHLSTDIPGLF